MSALPSFVESELMRSMRDVFAALATPTSAQKQAWNVVNQVGLPGMRDEHWKYTQLHRLYAHRFALPNFAADSNNDSTTLRIINGQLQSNLVADGGLTIKQETTPSFISKEPFVALNVALNPNSVVIDVADNSAIESPLMLEFISVAEHNSIACPRVVIRLGRGSKLTLLERHTSVNNVVHFNNVVSHIELGEGSKFEHCRVQLENAASFHIGNVQVALAKHAQYINHQYNLGGALGRIDINVQLNGAESYAELNGLQFAVDAQVHDTHSRVEHCVPHARSSETYHGIADQRGQVVFNGKVMVHKHAIGTDAKQSSRNLLLSPKAEIDTKPELEIYADDVKCAHGATVGQLDNTALFYLRSRGIGEQQARALLTVAFADAVINRVPSADLRDELTQQVHARFGNHMEAV